MTLLKIGIGIGIGYAEEKLAIGKTDCGTINQSLADLHVLEADACSTRSRGFDSSNS